MYFGFPARQHPFLIPHKRPINVIEMQPFFVEPFWKIQSYTHLIYIFFNYTELFGVLGTDNPHVQKSVGKQFFSLNHYQYSVQLIAHIDVICQHDKMLLNAERGTILLCPHMLVVFLKDFLVHNIPNQFFFHLFHYIIHYNFDMIFIKILHIHYTSTLTHIWCTSKNINFQSNRST